VLFRVISCSCFSVPIIIFSRCFVFIFVLFSVHNNSTYILPQNPYQVIHINTKPHKHKTRKYTEIFFVLFCVYYPFSRCFVSYKHFRIVSCSICFLFSCCFVSMITKITLKYTKKNSNTRKHTKIFSCCFVFYIYFRVV
jgi:hypothetical protein